MWWPILLTAGLVIAFLLRWRWYGIDWYSFLILYGARIYSRFLHRWTSNVWMAPFPDTGPFLVISNHTCSADPAFLLAACKRPMSFLVAREHYDVHWLIRALLNHLSCIKVARGGHDPGALRKSIRRLQEEPHASRQAGHRFHGPGHPGSRVSDLYFRRPTHRTVVEFLDHADTTGSPRKLRQSHRLDLLL